MDRWQRYVLVSVLVVEVVVIAEDMGVSLVCNLLQSQDVSTQTNVNENRAISDGSPSLGSPERRRSSNRSMFSPTIS